MAYPNNADYERAIAGGPILNQLSDVEILPSKTKPIKIYAYGAGSFAIVFKGRESGKNVAFRCFIQSSPNISDRYKEISRY